MEKEKGNVRRERKKLLKRMLVKEEESVRVVKGRKENVVKRSQESARGKIILNSS